jgi:DNA-binding NarL/FixJ family response regulator
MLGEARGEAICSPTITRRLTGYFATPMGDSKTTADQAFPNLSEREHEILSLIEEGYTNAAIASRLYLITGFKTLRDHSGSIGTSRDSGCVWVAVS